MTTNMMFTSVLMFIGILVCLSKAKPSAKRFQLVEGDMLLTKDQIQVYNQLENGRVRRAAVKGTNLLWPKGKVYYKFGDIGQRSKDSVKDAIKHWEEKTCLKFEEKRDAKYKLVFQNKVDADGYGIYNSFVGYMRWKEQPVNVGSKTEKPELGSIIHEIGHAIGFYHEHTRPDRKDFVEFKEENLAPYIISAKLQRNWDPKDESEVDSRGFDYDYGSIMHYSRTQGSKVVRKRNRAGKVVTERPPVLVPKKPNVEIGERKDLSEGDIAQAKAMYKCNAQGDSELEYDPSLDNEQDGKPTKKPEVYE